jgi:hypothetical protein
MSSLVTTLSFVLVLTYCFETEEEVIQHKTSFRQWIDDC